jgi:hypothetical protein
VLAAAIAACAPLGPRPGPPPAPSAAALPAAVPFASPLDLVVVPVWIDGDQAGDFLFDTGATITQIDQGLAARLSLPRPGGSVLLRRTAEAVVAELVRIESLAIGGAVAVGGVRAAATDLSFYSRLLGRPIAGIVGGDVIARFRVRLDYPGRTLTLWPQREGGPTPAGGAADPAEVELELRGRLPVLVGCLEGRLAVPLVVDTGLVGALAISDATWRRLGRDDADAYAVTNPDPGAGSAARIARLGSLLAAGREVRDLVVTIYPATATGFFGAGEDLGLVGATVLARFVVDLDLGRRRVALRTAAELDSAGGARPPPAEPCPAPVDV